MMKFIAVSDNHSEAGILYDIYQKHKDADVFFHLGDSEFQYDDTELSLFQRVKGNMDFYPEFPESLVEQQKGYRIFYTHGHRYEVNQSRQQLAEAAIAHQSMMALYGHTHVAKYEEINGVHVINPGSISQSRSEMEETYAEIVLEGSFGHVHFHNRNHERVKSVSFQLENRN